MIEALIDPTYEGSMRIEGYMKKKKENGVFSVFVVQFTKRWFVLDLHKLTFSYRNKQSSKTNSCIIDLQNFEAVENSPRIRQFPEDYFFGFFIATGKRNFNLFVKERDFYLELMEAFGSLLNLNESKRPIRPSIKMNYHPPISDDENSQDHDLIETSPKINSIIKPLESKLSPRFQKNERKSLLKKENEKSEEVSQEYFPFQQNTNQYSNQNFQNNPFPKSKTITSFNEIKPNQSNKNSSNYATQNYLLQLNKTKSESVHQISQKIKEGEYSVGKTINVNEKNMSDFVTSPQKEGLHEHKTERGIKESNTFRDKKPHPPVTLTSPSKSLPQGFPKRLKYSNKNPSHSTFSKKMSIPNTLNNPVKADFQLLNLIDEERNGAPFEKNKIDLIKKKSLLQNRKRNIYTSYGPKSEEKQKTIIRSSFQRPSTATERGLELVDLENNVNHKERNRKAGEILKKILRNDQTSSFSMPVTPQSQLLSLQNHQTESSKFAFPQMKINRETTLKEDESFEYDWD